MNHLEFPQVGGEPALINLSYVTYAIAADRPADTTLVRFEDGRALHLALPCQEFCNLLLWELYEVES